jgi:hypothetical protein
MSKDSINVSERNGFLQRNFFVLALPISSHLGQRHMLHYITLMEKWTNLASNLGVRYNEWNDTQIRLRESHKVVQYGLIWLELRVSWLCHKIGIHVGHYIILKHVFGGFQKEYGKKIKKKIKIYIYIYKFHILFRT